MNVMQCYSRKSVKLCQVAAGSVVLINYNDGRYDNNLYLVVDDRDNPRFNLVNLDTGRPKEVHTSTRVQLFPDAYCHLNNGE